MKQTKFPNLLIAVASVALALIALIIFFELIPPLSRTTPVTQIYYADNISAAHEELIQQFNNEFQGRIEVIPVDLPFRKFSTNERKEILARSLRSKTDRIDIFAVDQIWVPRFARWGLPLDPHFHHELPDINRFALESCYDHNQLVAIPLYVDIGVMYYRQDLLRRLPNSAELEQRILKSLTWEEFITLGKQLEHLNQPFYMFPGKNFEGLICCFHEMLHSTNPDLFSGDSLALNVPECRRTLEWLHGLINTYQLTPKAVTNFDDHDSYIFGLEKDALFIRGWPGFVKNYQFSIADTAKIQKFGMAPLPHFKGQEKFAVFGGWNLMISKNSAHKNECVEFLKFTLRSDIQKMLFEKGGYLPTRNELYTDSAFVHSHGELTFLRQQFQNGKHRPRRIDYTRISDILSYYINLVLKNEISIEEALKAASEKINSKQTFIK